MKIALLSIAALASLACPASAQPPATGLIGITRAVALAERHLSGQALDAELENDGGRLYYEIDLVKAGKPWEVRIDARTGRVLAGVAASAWWGWMQRGDAGHAARSRPLSGILSNWERRSGGRVTDVGFDVEGGRARYEIEIETRAGVAELHVDPRTGNRLTNVYDD